MKSAAIVVYLVMAIQSHSPLTPQQTISSYEAKESSAIGPGYIVQTDSKGCQDVMTFVRPTLKNPRIGSETMIYQYCPSK